VYLSCIEHFTAQSIDMHGLGMGGTSCTHACVVQWWEAEPQRAYVLHKARTLHEDAATRQQAPVPAYLSPRVQGGKRLPQVQVRGRGGSGGPRTRGTAKTGAEEEGQGETREEEMCAMVGCGTVHRATAGAARVRYGARKGRT
jgi:hypothetical protein